MAAQPERPAWESAVVVRVPDLDHLIGSLRRRFHLPLKPNGIPAHVTAIVPFLPRARLAEDGELPALRELCASIAPFAVTFAGTARFPHVLYLAPDPAEPFIALTRALTERWPEAQPYAGEHRRVIPHLTVTTSGSTHVFDAVAAELQRHLPISVGVGAAQLYLFDGRRWTAGAALPFRQG